MERDEAAWHDPRFEVVKVPSHARIIVEAGDQEEANRPIPGHGLGTRCNCLDIFVQSIAGDIAAEAFECRPEVLYTLIQRANPSIVGIDSIDTAFLASRLHHARQDDRGASAEAPHFND